ncbi:MAG: hypothetical protein WBR18_10890 [Anaerolineales bacterium]
MIYLEILPGFIVYLVVFGAITLIARYSRDGKPFFPFLWRSLLASGLAVLGANALLWVVVVSVGSYLTFTDSAEQVIQIGPLPAAFEWILHPLPVSVLGCLAGLAIGFAWALHARRSLGRRLAV